MKWSGAGAKLASQSSCAGGTVPALGAWGAVRRLRLAATKRKWRLCEAGAAKVFNQNHLPAVAGASLRVSSSVADNRLTIFMPDTAPEIIRQPERLECAIDVQTLEGVKRARGVAKGPPGMTSVNQ